LYISSGRTAGRAPAHPSPSLGGSIGGLYIAFIKESFVWQFTQVLGVAASTARETHKAANAASKIMRSLSL